MEQQYIYKKNKVTNILLMLKNINIFTVGRFQFFWLNFFLLFNKKAKLIKNLQNVCSTKQLTYIIFENISCFTSF